MVTGDEIARMRAVRDENFGMPTIKRPFRPATRFAVAVLIIGDGNRVGVRIDVDLNPLPVTFVRPGNAVPEVWLVVIEEPVLQDRLSAWFRDQTPIDLICILGQRVETLVVAVVTVSLIDVVTRVDVLQQCFYDRSVGSRARKLLPVLVLALGISVGAAAAAERSVVPRLLVLQPADLGAGYTRNASFSRPRTLKDAGSGDSVAVSRELQRAWVGGYQVGFSGRRVPWGVVSDVDIFSTGTLANIEHAWTADALAQTGGQAMKVPAGMPGSFRLLSQGTLSANGQTLDVLLYMWQRGRAIAVVHITGAPHSFSIALLTRLVEKQDLRIRNAFRR